MTDHVRRGAWLLGWGLALLAGAICVRLAMLGGYFSNDELQWGAYAAVPIADLPWVAWTDLAAFQYRPLTFNAWMLVSHVLFDQPRAFHLLWVLLATANAALLGAVLRAAGLAPRLAAAGACAFLAFPYAVYVHGWVGTLAELLWVGALLAAARTALAPGPAWRVVTAASLLTTVALLAKEAAVVIPALLAVGAAAAWHTPHRRPLLIAAGAAAVPVALYLALRLPVLGATRADSTGYGLALGDGPRHLLHYLVFPFLTPPFEVNGAFSRFDAAELAGLGLVVATLLGLALGVRRFGLLLLAAAAGLAPVLVLDRTANQYGYVLAAVYVSIGAWAWHGNERRWQRPVLLLLLLLAGIHGWRIADRMAHVAAIQLRFSSAAADALADPDAPPLRVWPACGERWIYLRLTASIPSYGGVPLGDRLAVAETADRATATIDCTGAITRR